MSKDLEKLTRDDLEQVLADHTDRVVGSVEELRGEMQQGFREAKEERDELRKMIMRIDQRTAEDTTLALKKIAVVEREMTLIKKHLSLA